MQESLRQRKLATWNRIENYSAMLKAGEINAFEWFMYTDPYNHDCHPSLHPLHESEAESQADFSARLDRFFAEEAPGLAEPQLQHRLDLLARAHVRKWFRDLLPMMRGPKGA